MPLIMPTFGKRSIESQSIEVKRKYFFAFEGNKKIFIGGKNMTKILGLLTVPFFIWILINIIVKN